MKLVNGLIKYWSALGHKRKVKTLDDHIALLPRLFGLLNFQILKLSHSALVHVNKMHKHTGVTLVKSGQVKIISAGEVHKGHFLYAKKKKARRSLYITKPLHFLCVVRSLM